MKYSSNIDKSYKPGYIGTNNWLFYDVALVYNFPMIVIKKRLTECIAQGGYLTGQINLFPLNKLDKAKPFNVCYSQITCLEMSRDERMIFIGNKAGECLIYENWGEAEWILRGHLTDHGDEICFIHINEEMQMFATASEDGFANVYDISFKPKLIRSYRQKSCLGIQYVKILLFYTFVASRYNSIIGFFDDEPNPSRCFVLTR